MLGNQFVTAMYLDGTKVWPFQCTLLGNYVNGWTNPTSADVAASLVGETGLVQCNNKGFGGIVNWNGTGSWSSNNNYSYAIAGFQNFRATEYYDAQCVGWAKQTWEHGIAKDLRATRKWHYPNMVELRGTGAQFTNQGITGSNGAGIMEMIFPKGRFVSSVTFTAMDSLSALSGSLTINSAVSASTDWPVNRDWLLARAWTINYVNG